MEAGNGLPRLEESDTDPALLYELGGTIAQCQFGGVFGGIDRRSRRAVAVKLIETLQFTSKSDWRMLENEVGLMKECNCRHIVQMIDSHLYNGRMWIVMEYCAYNSIADLMERQHAIFDESSIAFIAFQVLKGIEYLHTHRIIHRDLKCSNVLINEEGVVKVADLGIAVRDKVSLCHPAGSPHWMAPELLTCDEEASPASDIWSFGILLYELSQGTTPYHDASLSALIETAQKKIEIQFPASWTDTFRSFVACCLQHDARHRCTASELLKHPFITQSQFTQSSWVQYVQTFKASPVLFPESYRRRRKKSSTLSSAAFYEAIHSLTDYSPEPRTQGAGQHKYCNNAPRSDTNDRIKSRSLNHIDVSAYPRKEHRFDRPTLVALRLNVDHARAGKHEIQYLDSPAITLAEHSLWSFSSPLEGSKEALHVIREKHAASHRKQKISVYEAQTVYSNIMPTHVEQSDDINAVRRYMEQEFETIKGMLRPDLPKGSVFNAIRDYLISNGKAIKAVVQTKTHETGGNVDQEWKRFITFISKYD